MNIDIEKAHAIVANKEAVALADQLIADGNMTFAEITEFVYAVFFVNKEVQKNEA